VLSPGKLFESGNEPLGYSGFFYRLFGRIKDPLRGRHFASDQEVKEAVPAWLVIQPKTFIYGTEKAVDRWTKCVEKVVECIEK
jgi:hypothetical protein